MTPTYQFKKKDRKLTEGPRTETHVGVSLSEAHRESRITCSFVCVCKSIGNGVEMNGRKERK